MKTEAVSGGSEGENAEKGEKKGSAKSSLVLKAARSSFLDYGYDRTSVDMIAQAAGVSKATVYAHFDGKEALLLGLIEEEFQTNGPPPLWDREQPVTDVEESLRDIARRFTSIFLSDEKLAFHRLIVTNASRFPQMAEMFLNGGPRRQVQEVRAFLEKGVNEGFFKIKNLDLAARQFLSLVEGDLPLNWALSMKPPELARYEELIEGGVRVFLDAYGTTGMKP